MIAAEGQALAVMAGVPVGVGGLGPNMDRNLLIVNSSTGKALDKLDEPVRHCGSVMPRQVMIKDVSDVSHRHGKVPLSWAMRDMIVEPVSTAIKLDAPPPRPMKA